MLDTIMHHVLQQCHSLGWCTAQACALSTPGVVEECAA